MINSPQIPGYRVNVEKVEGIMGDEDIAYHIVYTPIDYTVTVIPVASDGTPLADAVVISGLHIGDAYEVLLPDIPGYVKVMEKCTGVCGTQDRTIRILYILLGEDFELINDYGVPLHFGHSAVNVGDCCE